MIYVDASAVVKLAHHEAHSQDLLSWLNRQPEMAVASSVVVEIEINRALRRSDPGALVAVPVVLARLHRVELTPTIRAMAASYAHIQLRTLDAIHLATAGFLALTRGNEELTFVAYDARLLAFARAESLEVASPGQS